jgi:hypothetical protein
MVTFNQYSTSNGPSGESQGHYQELQASQGVGANGQKVLMMQHVEKKTVRRKGLSR